MLQQYVLLPSNNKHSEKSPSRSPPMIGVAERSFEAPYSMKVAAGAVGEDPRKEEEEAAAEEEEEQQQRLPHDGDAPRTSLLCRQVEEV